MSRKRTFDHTNKAALAERRERIVELIIDDPNVTPQVVVEKLHDRFGSDVRHARRIARKIMVSLGWDPAEQARVAAKLKLAAPTPTTRSVPRSPSPSRGAGRAPDWGPDAALAGPLDAQADTAQAAETIARWEWRANTQAFRVLESRVVHNEGFRENLYHCTADLLTIGIGLNVQAYQSAATVLILAQAARERLTVLINDLRLRREPVCLAPGGVLTNVGRMVGLPDGISEATARMVLRRQLHDLCDVVDCDPVYSKLDPIRRGVIVEMMFQLGRAGVEKFVKMKAALKRLDFEAAAEEMQDSKWKIQTPARCDYLSEVMRTGKAGGDTTWE